MFYTLGQATAKVRLVFNEIKSVLRYFLCVICYVLYGKSADQAELETSQEYNLGPVTRLDEEYTYLTTEFNP